VKALLLAVGLVLLLLPRAVAAQGDDLTTLSLEINALQALTELDLEPGQLRTVAGLAKGAAADKPAAKTVKPSAEFVKTLKALHAALLKGEGERVPDLQTKIDELREKETLDLGDRVPLTDTARKRAPQFLKLLSVRQLGSVIGDLELVGPYDRLVDAIEQVRGLSADDLNTLRDEVTEEIGRLVFGTDAKRAGELSKKAAALLDEAHDLKDADFKKQQKALEGKARSLIGRPDNLRVLGHIVEHRLAELLSNPAFAKAVEVLMKR